MKIAELRIKNYKQFKDIKLDFTDPSGKPLEKICFIGRNGTGKSTILNILNDLISNLSIAKEVFSFSEIKSFISLKIYINGMYIILFHSVETGNKFYLSSEIEKKYQDWFKKITTVTYVEQEINKHFRYLLSIEKINIDIPLKDNTSDLLIYSPPESSQNSYMNIDDVPETNVNIALTLFKSFPYKHIVSDQNIQEFWKLLIYFIKKRENERDEFENKKENIEKTKRQLIEEFDDKNNKILNKIADLWNKILENAGLEFDLENANNPIQLTDNLKAYIRLKATKEQIEYNQLSTGIRNFIFRVGHIFSLYFNREIKKGFLLLDEPENSLFPDFLFDLMETYQEIVLDKNGENNTQIFVSTHNPIIAAQFQPYERIILEWNKEGFVNAYKGKSPIGDDPNDLLHNDFKLKNLMGKEGQKMWNTYMELRKKLIRSENEQEKSKLISEINKIGELYNFEA